ncbi:MAG: hypothetical protein K5925_06390 [Bacilli bacterium]|nr:hypothetical protein [Bacilli bacterium]
MYFISQSGKHDCAFTCLAMMLANYHKDKNYLFLKHEDRNYSFKELMILAESFNMTLLGVQIESVGELTKSDKFPFIVTIKVSEKAFHCVLLLKATKKYVLVYDPAVGKRKIGLREFEEVWTNKALIVKNYMKSSCPFVPPTFIAKKDKVTLPLWQILSGVSLLAGTYFISKDALIFIPIALFSLFVVFELVFRENLVGAMRRMDAEINSYSLDITKEKYYELYSNIERYRKAALTKTPNIIYTMLIAIFIIIILILNGTINLVYIALAFGYSIFEAFVFEPFIEMRAKEIIEDEKKISLCENDDEYYHYSQEAREKAYHLGIVKTVFTYLGVAIFLVATILVMALSQVVSVTYVVFYLCIILFLKSNFIKVFSFNKQEEDYDNYLNKLINSLKIEE